MKKWILSSLVTTSLLFTAACGGGDDTGNAEGGDSGGDSQDDVTLRLAHTGSDSHQYNIAAEKFKELVEEKTDGSVTIEIHGNANLGSEDEAVEQILDGTLDMTTVAADSSFSNTVPVMNVFGIPYIFEDRDHVYSVLDGEIGQDLLSQAEEKNMKALGYWEVGFRHLTNNETEITTPGDMEGLSIRVQPSKVWEAHMEALGASPTPVDFNELYSALDQGVVDGQENPLPTIDSMKFYEVQDYVSLTAHTYSPAITVASSNAWDKLSEEQQTAVQEAVDETTEYQREELQNKEEEIMQTLEENGVTITEDPDREAFREATSGVKDVLSEEVPSSLLEEIEAAK
ncbi:TRAP transporter substrate-binding protein [Salibacterium aidingense]|uniref:TRAP transporter substrate-binding protein n=1 Tax=Salibacterium aidingense TaxID=384933 RepID=UPI00040C7C01|nr:DctP family TRAP transporter solute-binding subunit [Salibacterium aidingense]